MQEGRVTGELFEGEWYDIGTPERLEMLNAHLFNTN
jgi:MurNAc alpha-1-phosphate uridylyltransferase